MNIRQSSDRIPRKISGLYQGDAFTGKTECACSWPKVALVSFDPDTQTAEHHDGVTIIELDTWKEFADTVMPHVINRTLHELCRVPEIETLAVDTLSIGASRLVDEIQGNKPKLAIQDYGLLLSKLTEATVNMTDATKPRGDKPCYNVILTTHLREMMNEDGALTGIRPAIPGQFQNLLPRLVGFAFLCESKLETVTVPGQPARSEVVYQVRTVPPNRYYVCGDRIGGGAGRKTLPPITSGLYPDLAKAWGIES